MQLTNETYVDAVEMLSGAIVATENSTSEQTGEVLGKVAGYLDDLADFVNESNVIIDTNVCVCMAIVLSPFHARILISNLGVIARP